MSAVLKYNSPKIVECVYEVQVGGEPGTDYDHAESLLAHLERLIEEECRDADEKEPHHAKRDPMHKSNTAFYTHGLRQVLENLVRVENVAHWVLKEAHADGVRFWIDDHQRLCFHAGWSAHEKWAKQIGENRDEIAIAVAKRTAGAGHRFEGLDLSDRAREEAGNILLDPNDDSLLPF
jgi:hypothetical protein